jgi:hypothetical protein
MGSDYRKTISEIKTDTDTLTDPTQIAEEFNNFFSNIGSKIASSIPPSSTDPLSYLPDTSNTSQLNFNQTDCARRDCLVHTSEDECK